MTKHEKTIREKAKELKRQYAKEWRRNNPDKIREYQDRYWQKRAAQEIEPN